MARLALGQPRAQAPSLVYAGPASCPREEEFVRRLRAHLGASQQSDRTRRTLDVRLARADSQYVGRLSLVEPDGRSTTKTLTGRDCGELVDALSLVAALALQSDAAQTTGDQPPAPAPAEPPASRHDRPREPTRRWRLGLELGGLVAAGPAPTVLLGGDLGFDWAVVTASPFSPALGLGIIAGAAPDVTRAGGKASFSWFAARVTACAVRFAVGQVLQIRGCFLGDVGLVNARGSDTALPESSSRGWFSLGASSQLEFPAGARFAVRLVAAAQAPLRRDRYAFGAVDFFEVPAVIATGSLAAVGYFW
jgi:hypothetical protein